MKTVLIKLRSWEYTGLCLLVLVTLALHFSIINQAEDMVFDEQFYVPDARLILSEQATERIEHPPLGKLFVALGMYLFGDNPLGWRFFSVIFGAMIIVLFYLICRNLSMSEESSFLAAMLLSFENLSFVMSGIAMLDVFSVAFMLMAFWLYLKGKYLTSGLSIGLSTLSKLSGALSLPVLFLHWLVTNRKQPKRFLASLLLSAVSFLVLMPLFDFVIWRSFPNPVKEIKLMLNVTVFSTFFSYPSEMLSRPWQWIFQPLMVAFYPAPHYLAMISPSLLFLIIPLVAYMIYRAKGGNNTAFFGLFWFTGTYLTWLPISLITDRMSYVYYFYPTLGAICIGAGLALSHISSVAKSTKSAVIRRIITVALPIYILVHLAAFSILAPVPLWWKVPGCLVAYVLARHVLEGNKRFCFK